jgi:hypothetical protein
MNNIEAMASQYRTSDTDATNTATLTSYAALMADVQEAVRREAIAARTMGHTWAQIGEALGMSKQAAQQRFSQ